MSHYVKLILITVKANKQVSMTWKRHSHRPQASLQHCKQCLHMLEKYLDIQVCLEKSMKIKFSLKSTLRTLKCLKKSLNFTIDRRIQLCFGDLNQFKIVVPVFGAAYAAPNTCTTISNNYLKLISLVMD